LLDRLRAGPVRLADCDPAIAALLIDDGLAERQGRRLTLPR
jgi:hypothetical protein